MSKQQILIDPVTRVEGHAKITIHLDEQGLVEDARFHVAEFRGFEKLCEGRPFYEMPSLMSRICGICPVSHLIASAKACDQIMAVRIPDAASELRKIMNFAQVVQSHALSFFHLSSPDLLLGLDSDPVQRNIFGVIQANPAVARDGILLRKFGQSIIESLGKKRVHGNWVVPGGVSEPLALDKRDEILRMIPDALAAITRTLDWFKRDIDQYRDEIRTFANFPSLFMALIHDSGHLGFYHGSLRIVDATGKIVADRLDPAKYQDYIGEAVEPWSYLKFPYYKPMGYPAGLYRVGPLARLNCAESCGTLRADEEWAEFRNLERGAILSSFHYHYARLIEILFAIERIEQLMNHPYILDKHVRAYASVNNLEGIGVSEAPRGTLIHHYKVDENGLITHANLIIATGHNNLAMNKGVLQVAKHYVKGGQLTEGALNRVEAVIRAFDPCLSCSTHAFGSMPLQVQVLAPDGEVLDQKQRG
ncbi:MAG: Ni/Fe hydrogenase subunit alpha [Anaerolineae bacterium]